MRFEIAKTLCKNIVTKIIFKIQNKKL